MSVQILMSTYNGECYLKTQIESIISQNYQNIELLIRDDGSIDSTKEILRFYTKKYAWIHWYSGENIGVQKSFYNLIQQAPLGKKYYAFADQDDKWLPEKISRAVDILDKYRKDIPTLYCSDKIIVDKRLEPLKVTVRRVVKKTSFGNALVQSMCTGCTAVLNRTLMEYLRQQTPEYMIMHDWWLYLTASCFGKVFYDNESYILYRQHEKNTSGAMINNKDLLIYRIRAWFNPRGMIYRQNEEFLRLYDHFQISNRENGNKYNCRMPIRKKEMLCKLLRSRDSLLYRIKVVFNVNIYRQKILDDVIMRILVLVGKL